jgi:hypothetical protein
MRVQSVGNDKNHGKFQLVAISVASRTGVSVAVRGDLFVDGIAGLLLATR